MSNGKFMTSPFLIRHVQYIIGAGEPFPVFCVFDTESTQLLGGAFDPFQIFATDVDNRRIADAFFRVRHRKCRQTVGLVFSFSFENQRSCSVSPGTANNLITDRIFLFQFCRIVERVRVDDFS